MNAEPLKSYWYPDRTADLKEVKKGYNAWENTQRLFYMVAMSLLAVCLAIFYRVTDISDFYQSFIDQVNKESRHKEFWIAFSMFIGGLAAFTCMSTIYYMKRSRSVYLVDFVTYQPPDELKFPHEKFLKKTQDVGWFDQSSIEFQEKLLHRTGIGQETYFPPGIVQDPPDTSMAAARKEADMVITASLDQLFAQTRIRPTDVDILIINCSLFNPTPSLVEMAINKYKMRSDIRCFNLAGMGCSAGLVSIDLAKDLLQVHKNSLAVVLSTENITQNWYKGRDKSMLISNTLFRLGGAAILLSNKWSDRWRAKYSLTASVRVHKGASDKAYRAVYQEEDADGTIGVKLSKNLIDVAGDALKSNLTILGPVVLPWSEQIKFFIVYLVRKYEQLTQKEKRTPSYVPDFKKAFHHFCIHAGGRAIIDGLEENLKLTPEHVEPSRATLYRYGNTSSSSIWYELAFIELSGRIRKGDNVFQIALGSGFQCNSAVWKRLTP